MVDQFLSEEGLNIATLGRLIKRSKRRSLSLLLLLSLTVVHFSSEEESRAKLDQPNREGTRQSLQVTITLYRCSFPSLPEVVFWTGLVASP